MHDLLTIRGRQISKPCGKAPTDQLIGDEMSIDYADIEKDQAERAYYCRTIAKIDPTGHRTMPLLQEALKDPFKARLTIEMARIRH